MKCIRTHIQVLDYKLSNYYEPAEPVVMVMASIDVKIRHVFADTPLTEESIGAAPPGTI